MLEDGPLRHLIADTYAKDTLKQIKRFTSSCRSHRIVPVANGLLQPAVAKAAIPFPVIRMSGYATM
jgi:hypothetical protein